MRYLILTEYPANTRYRIWFSENDKLQKIDMPYHPFHRWTWLWWWYTTWDIRDNVVLGNYLASKVLKAKSLDKKWQK